MIGGTVRSANLNPIHLPPHSLPFGGGGVWAPTLHTVTCKIGAGLTGREHVEKAPRASHVAAAGGGGGGGVGHSSPAAPSDPPLSHSPAAAANAATLAPAAARRPRVRAAPLSLPPCAPL